MSDAIWTTQAALNWTVSYFEEHAIGTPRLDAELLLAFVCQCERMTLYVNYDKPLSMEERSQFRELIKGRIAGKPVAYLLQKKAFWQMELFVKEGILIPRPDTETLVEIAVSQIQQWQESHEEPCRILELGTGSGAIPLALCHELTDLHITTVDKSPIAIEVSRQNRDSYSDVLEPRNNQLEILQSDRFEVIPKEASFDFIISNPPYIPKEVIPTLQKEVCEHEPHEALDGGTDGTDFYHYLFEEGPQFLKPGGELLLEIGSDQSEILQQKLQCFPEWSFEGITPDLAGNPRVFSAKRQL